MENPVCVTKRIYITVTVNLTTFCITSHQIENFRPPSNKHQNQTTMDVFEKQPLCVTLHDLKTKYNENPAIPAYSGIMFDVSSRRDMELIAMEIDIRLDQATTLDVEIFTTAGSFLANIHNESMWTKLADSKATVAPDGRGIIVPEKDFTPLKMKEREKRSFYIQMKGPWIDIRAEALDKTGELQQQSDDLTVFVGVGLNSSTSSYLAQSIPSDLYLTFSSNFFSINRRIPRRL